MSWGPPAAAWLHWRRDWNVLKHHWEVCVPRPIRYPIPILLGGGGEKVTLRLVAHYADDLKYLWSPASVCP